MAALLRIALDEEEPVYVRLQAIRDALDRAGLGAKHARPLTVEPDDPYAAFVAAVTDLSTDRSTIAIEGGRVDQRQFAIAKAQEDANLEAWSDTLREEAEAFEQSHISSDGHVVVNGSVVEEPAPTTEEAPEGTWRRVVPARQRKTREQLRQEEEEGEDARREEDARRHRSRRRR